MRPQRRLSRGDAGAKRGAGDPASALRGRRRGWTFRVVMATAMAGYIARVVIAGLPRLQDKASQSAQTTTGAVLLILCLLFLALLVGAAVATDVSKESVKRIRSPSTPRPSPPSRSFSLSRR